MTHARVQLAPDAYTRMLDLLVRGELAPGARLTEPAVAERLEISRTPVREAMHRLHLEGLLVTDGGGARPRMAVAPLDVHEARALYHATGLLESAGAQAIQDFTHTQRRALATALRADDVAFRKEVQSGAPDPAVLYAKHHAFHQRIADTTATAVCRSLLRALEPRLARYEWFHGVLVQQSGVSFTPTFEEHAVIVSNIRTGTARAIEKAIRSNWTNAAERLAFAITRASTNGAS
jgi:DNA-binding GntR family transcriptional regulator